MSKGAPAFLVVLLGASSIHCNQQDESEPSQRPKLEIVENDIGERAASDEWMIPFERQGFAMYLPPWPIRMDIDMGSSGAWPRSRKLARFAAELVREFGLERHVRHLDPEGLRRKTTMENAYGEGHRSVTTLPAEFGVVEDSIVALVHADGSALVIFPRTPEVIASAVEALDLGEFGGHAETWRADTTRVRHLHDKFGGSAVLSAFQCDDVALGYLVFAVARNRSDAELEQLLLRVGCPRPNDPSILARPTACEVGASDWCEPE